MEAFTSYLSTSVFVTIGSLSSPHMVLTIRIVTSNFHNAALGYGLLVPGYLYRSHHGLTRIAKAPWWPVIEHIPLTVDFL